MSTSSLSFPHLARRVDPGAHEQDRIARIPRAGSELVSQLIGHLNNTAHNPDEFALQIAKCTTRYCRAVQEMRYQDTRQLLGLLTAARTGELRLEDGIARLTKDAYTSQELRGAIKAIESIHQLRARQEPSDQLLQLVPPGGIDRFQDTFLQSAILLTRVAAPLGINIVNPEWNRDKMPTGLPAHKTYLLWLHGSSSIDDRAAIAIKPTVRGDGVKIKLIEQGDTWESTATEASLKPGESILVGRRLHLSSKPAMESGSLFGLAVPDLAIQPELNPSLSFRDQKNAEQFSRAAFQIALLNDHLYVLDLGSRYGITCPLENGAYMTYRPQTVIDGRHSVLGQTEISRVPRPRLGD